MGFLFSACDCCPAPTELGEKSGFGRWAQHHVKLLGVPLQGEVGAECEAALVLPGVMLKHFPWVFPASPMALSEPQPCNMPRPSVLGHLPASFMVAMPSLLCQPTMPALS